MPSYFEGQCIAVLEAMAYGCAAIATRVGGLQQTFCDGEDGVLIDPQSAGALIRHCVIYCWMNSIREK